MTQDGTQSIGARLKAAREQSGLSLRQIADATKLTVRVLDALETDRVALLPGGIYRRAIVRAYAREIGLNPEVMLRAFLVQHPDDLPALPPLPTRKPTSYDLPAAPEQKAERSRLIPSALSVLGALVPIVAGVFYFTVGVGRADTPRHVADLTPPRSTAVWEPEIVPAAGFVEAPPMFERPVSMLITVSSQCALQVIADGREVFARQFAPGEIVQLDLSQDIVLAGDDAGAVHFSINGRAGRSLGASGTPLNVRIGRDDYDSWVAQP